MNDVLQASLAKSTQTLYRRAWRALSEFGTQSQLCIFPLDIITLGLFIVHLHDRNYAPNSIRTFVSAIAHIHKMHQLPDPSASFLITKTFQGLRKLRPTVDTRQPITSDLLHKLIGSLSKAHRTSYDIILFRAMFLFAFYALCRISELTHTPSGHNLHFSDIRFLTNPHRLIVTFRTFKHSHAKQSITLYPQPGSSLCPLLCLCQYLAVRPSTSQYLFTLSTGSPVPRLMFVHTLKQSVVYSQHTKKYIYIYIYIYKHAPNVVLCIYYIWN